LHVTTLEQGLFYVLAANTGRVVTREEVLDALQGFNNGAESTTVDRQIRKLRARRLPRAVFHRHGPWPRQQATLGAPSWGLSPSLAR
jgi:hypothetical protein